MSEALPASAAGKPVEIWFQDEARVGQKGSLEYIWAPVGSRPPMVRDNRHDSAYLFGAICHARAVGAAIIMPTVNTEAMNEHLKEISTQVSPGAHAVLVCDGAGWHQSGKRLRTPDNITLLPLPPYSPELTWGDLDQGNSCSRCHDFILPRLYQIRGPSPFDVTRLVAELDQTHIRPASNKMRHQYPACGGQGSGGARPFSTAAG